MNCVQMLVSYRRRLDFKSEARLLKGDVGNCITPKRSCLIVCLDCGELVSVKIGNNDVLAHTLLPSNCPLPKGPM